MRFEQLARYDPLSLRPINDPVRHELPQGFFIRMLQLAATTRTEMLAWRFDAVWPRSNRAVRLNHVTGNSARKVSSIRRDSIALGGDADDSVGVAHS